MTGMTGARIIGTYRIANVLVRIESLHVDVHELCQAYRCDEEPELVVRTDQADIDFERERSKAADDLVGHATHTSSDGYLETLAVYRQAAEAMPTLGVVLVHGSCVAVDGRAYLFCAPSGTGKSTHARLWRELLGERALMVNDDKPLIRVADGSAIACGTPWDGKHRLSINVAVPLRAVCLLGRGEVNHIERASAEGAYTALLGHVYRPFDPAALALTLGLVERLTSCVTLWKLSCTIDIAAAALSFSSMSGDVACGTDGTGHTKP